jgi:hypothetical protein
MRLLAMMFLLAAFATGCGDDDKGGASDVADTSSTAGDGDVTVDPRCAPLDPTSFQPLVFDGQDDVSTSYSFRLTTPPIGAVPAPDFLVMQFINYNERIGDLAVGTFALDAAPNDNFGTCPECIAVWVDQPDIFRPPAKFLFQRAGTIRLDVDPRSRRLKGRIEGLVLQEIEVDPMTLSSTFVDDGACVRLTGPIALDFRWVPEAWTCDEAAYNAGDGCDCGCGDIDPDCYDEDFQQVTEFRGCAEGLACHYGECRERCSAFAPLDACSTGTCMIEWPDDLCSSDDGLRDPATLGQACTRPGSLVCAVQDGIMRGLCSNHSEDGSRTCMPLCNGRKDCPSGAFCYTLYAGGRLGEGKGYCLEGIPPSWLCEDERYEDGTTCDCGCGDIDPDCDVAGRPLRGCEGDEVCDDQASCVSP